MHDYKNSVYLINNRKIELTKLENELLNILLENKGRVVYYREICLAMYSYYEFEKIDLARVRTIKNRLVKKTQIIIKTCIGRGYMIN